MFIYLPTHTEYHSSSVCSLNSYLTASHCIKVFYEIDKDLPFLSNVGYFAFRMNLIKK